MQQQHQIIFVITRQTKYKFYPRMYIYGHNLFLNFYKLLFSLYIFTFFFHIKFDSTIYIYQIGQQVRRIFPFLHSFLSTSTLRIIFIIARNLIEEKKKKRKKFKSRILRAHSACQLSKSGDFNAWLTVAYRIKLGEHTNRGQ